MRRHQKPKPAKKVKPRPNTGKQYRKGAIEYWTARTAREATKEYQRA